MVKLIMEIAGKDGYQFAKPLEMASMQMSEGVINYKLPEKKFHGKKVSAS